MRSGSTATKTLLLTSWVLINTILMVLLITSLGFFAGIKLSYWQFPVSFVLSAFSGYYFGNGYLGSRAAGIRSVIISLAVIVASIGIALLLYDVSWDGQSYHQEGIYQFKNGWNSFKTWLPDSVNMAIYVNHYSKGVELPQAAIYAFTNHIEAGKATNFILLAGAFCLTLSYLVHLRKLSKIKCIIISLLAVGNPIIVNQLISTYVDGQLATMLLCFFISILWIAEEASTFSMLLLGASLIIIANVKFTGLVYDVMFLAFVFGWMFLAKRTDLLKKTFFTAVIAAIIGICFVGYNPYVMNTRDFSHPLYPLMGPKKADIFSYNMPNGLENKSGPVKFLTSLFAHTNNITPDNGQKVELKIPFTFNKTDIGSASKIDARIGGLGPMYGGILLLCALLTLILLYRQREQRAVRNVAYIFGVIFLSGLIMPESWWARYIPQFWYAPLAILLCTELYPLARLAFLKWILYGAIVLNIGFTFIGIGWNVAMTILVHHQLADLKTMHHPVIVQWGDAKSNRIRFMENNIPFVEQNLDGVEHTENIIRSDSKYLKTDTMHLISKSKFVLWAEKFQ